MTDQKLIDELRAEGPTPEALALLRDMTRQSKTEFASRRQEWRERLARIAGAP